MLLRTQTGRGLGSSLWELVISPSTALPSRLIGHCDHEARGIQRRAHGDLSWDSFEPSQGKFEFEWFDKVMDKMQANGIRGILDIPGSPTPIWLNRAYPGVDIVSQNGTPLPSAERYMNDIGDPDYVRELEIFADALTKRFEHHPAVIAIGYDNEIGSGFMLYSEADRQRFISDKRVGETGSFCLRSEFWRETGSSRSPTRSRWRLPRVDWELHRLL
jgi:beta-galactosidase GanA